MTVAVFPSVTDISEGGMIKFKSEAKITATAENNDKNVIFNHSRFTLIAFLMYL
jgi:hypothetical protein